MRYSKRRTRKVEKKNIESDIFKVHPRGQWFSLVAAVWSLKEYGEKVGMRERERRRGRERGSEISILPKQVSQWFFFHFSVSHYIPPPPPPPEKLRSLLEKSPPKKKKRNSSTLTQLLVACTQN